jgi:serine/threonine protein kinase
MAAFFASGSIVHDFIDTYITQNPTIFKIAANDNEIVNEWYTLIHLESGAYGTVRINKSREYVVKQMNIIRQIEKGEMYAMNIIRNEVLIYHYISQKCEGVCSFIGCYYHKSARLLYVKSKYCGKDLHTKLFGDFHQRFNFDTKRAIFGKIIDNLKCLHDNGVVYRDLKPENITVSDDNTVTFIDFGLSYFCGNAVISDELKMNQDRNIIGTKLYGDPTQPIADDDELKKTDTYSLGVLFMMMFSDPKYLDFLITFSGTSFMSRVEKLDETSQKSFWIDFNEKIKLILGDGIDNTNFFGGFDTRLTSADLQNAFNRPISPEYHDAALLYDNKISSIDKSISQRSSNKNKSVSKRSSNNSEIVSKNKFVSKNSSASKNSSLNKIYMPHQNPMPNKIIVPIGIRGSPPISYSEYLSKMGGNNKTKRHKKTRSRKTYRRK